MNLVDHYLVDLQDRKPSVLIYSKDDIGDDLEFYNAKTPLELSDLDWRIFNSEDQAERFLRYYQKARDLITENKNGRFLRKDFSLPCMLYPRRYLALTFLGLKTETYRHYDKPKWELGDHFYFNDQFRFIKVCLTGKTHNSEGWCYKYRVE